jgi:hypothetical protein
MTMAASAKPNRAIPAPRCDTSKPSDWWEHIADISAADVDLRQRQYGGNHAAQRVRLVNSTAGDLVAVLIQEHGEAEASAQNLTVRANSEYEVPRAIRRIESTGSGALQADVFWWFASNTMPNP